jgi:HTH-type transcriptional repressor of NAD biosynthesis genes
VKDFRHGLFIGKFYPPHLGHHAAIRTAAQRCERVTVVVMVTVAETIDLADRVAWLRSEHSDSSAVKIVGVRCDAPLDLGDDHVWTAQIAVMDAGVRSVCDEPVDAVFSADHYGRELAERFKAKFVGLERALSATSVRTDLAGTWWNLAPATRAGLATRVIVLGAESTGTTTVSRELAEHYRRRGGVWANTGWVGEYGREYTGIKWDVESAAARSEGRPGPALDAIVWNREDFDRVAREQTAAEERAARTGSPLLICDTDAFATTIWERRYLGAGARTGQDWSRAPVLPRRDLYLLTDHRGVPWSDDGLREGDLALRAAMTGWFADALTAAGHSWVLLSGPLVERVKLAVRSVDQLLTYRMRFGTPLSGPGFEGESERPGS